MNELAKLMAERLGKTSLKPVHQPERAGDVKHSLADLNRAGQLLAYTPIVAFEAGLAPTLDWYQKTLATTA